jgi:hypothetical protein
MCSNSNTISQTNAVDFNEDYDAGNWQLIPPYGEYDYKDE